MGKPATLFCHFEYSLFYFEMRHLLKIERLPISETVVYSTTQRGHLNLDFDSSGGGATSYASTSSQHCPQDANSSYS